MSTIKLFESKQIRTVLNQADEKWYFVVEDVVAVLTDSRNPKQYIKRMRQRDIELAKGWVQFVPTLAVDTPGGKQKMGCANAKGLLRIIQSIPSPKAGSSTEKMSNKPSTDAFQAVFWGVFCICLLAFSIPTVFYWLQTGEYASRAIREFLNTHGYEGFVDWVYHPREWIGLNKIMAWFLKMVFWLPKSIIPAAGTAIGICILLLVLYTLGKKTVLRR